MPAHARVWRRERAVVATAVVATAVVATTTAVAQWGGGSAVRGAQHTPRMLLPPPPGLPPPPPPPPGLPPPPPPPLLMLPKPLAGPRPRPALEPFLSASGCTHSTPCEQSEGVAMVVLGRDESRATARRE